MWTESAFISLALFTLEKKITMIIYVYISLYFTKLFFNFDVSSDLYIILCVDFILPFKT